jgi:cytochrome oxidase Cu insertion factor (SCO1/SenC/PrrC family)
VAGPRVSSEVTEQRSSPALSEAERADAFRRDEPKVPRNFFLWVVGAVVVLGLGGALAEHLLSSVGLNPVSTSSTTTPTFEPAVLAPPGSPPSAGAVNASLAAFMGITSLPGSPAPPFSLVDQSGRPVSLTAERGDAVVVTFFDSPCQDICPVLSAELRHAAAALGPQAAHVVFLTVNTDPDVLSAAPASAAAARTGLAALPTWHFLTSSLGNLNQVWKNYGVTVNVSPSTGLVAHNDVMYFIGPTGRLRYRATPFADENAAGVYSLSPTDVARWGQGIATYAGGLIGGSS